MSILGSALNPSHGGGDKDGIGEALAREALERGCSISMSKLGSALNSSNDGERDGVK